MIITEKIGWNNKPIFILSKTENTTQDAFDSPSKEYLEQIKEHANKGGFFHTVSKKEQINGVMKVFASRDFWTILAKTREQGDYELFNKVFLSTENELKKAQRKNKNIIYL